ncbi:XRE family transcriptional regulator [Micromonospora sp. ATCC 39149]|uniref:Helix-turn-helix domain-containing protein n=1 Tax=Micromonospora carbonacea TaxID=47853 RepID=A0A7D5Y9M5_9ACTN|nr:helix-turn-helix domain-containing protein [Micromonospora sp. ATCC 39149]EEP72588.1 XRE family transcriptional regulator [Micromonospora sp. ATCC 39149]QLJ98700.1 helix-turn-helix domain-containing protein [Micromonospora carbonacea]
MAPDHGRPPGTDGRTGLSDLLRTHRHAAGLTQAELASRAGVGVRTVRDLERGRSARPQRTTVDLLAGALGLAGPARAAFVAVARGTAPADPARAAAEPPSPTAPPPGSPQPVGAGPPPTTHPGGTPIALPPPVELIGRERDVAELVELLTADHGQPVVSLVGLAGVGKTALALAVAHAVAARAPGGAAGVLVGEGSDAADVLSAAAAVFGAARPPDLAVRLAGRPALLLIDAVERAPDPVAEALHRLAGAVPTLRVLVTGRHPVGAPGERVWPVPPLDVPPPELDPADPDVLAGYPAVALFTTRLARVRREPPDPAELPALAALARRLGGLPLAIELMAARGRILDLNELLDRYGDRVLDLATSPVRPPGSGWAAGGGATVTLRDAVAASYRLLAPDERAALRRLSAFRNRWSVELAEEMLADDADPEGTVAVDPVPLLDRLLQLGLLSVRGTGPFRFRLLDAVREFAAEQAIGAGEQCVVRRRHAEVFARLVARTAPELAGPQLASAVRRLDEATGDITAALAHAAVDDPSTALRLAVGLARWWRFRGRDVVGRQWLRRLLADPRTADADPGLRARAALGAARLAVEHGAAEQELPTARDAWAVLHRAGDVAGELEARTVLCALLVATGGHDEARDQAAAVLALATRNGWLRDMAVAQNSLAWHDIRVGDLAGARRRLAAMDRLSAQAGERRLRILARANLAEVTRLEGRYADAVEQGRRVVAGLVELGDPGDRRRAVGTIGLALAQDGRPDEAAEVLASLRTRAADDAVLGAEPPRGRPGEWRFEDGICALIEANIALHRADRELAAEWFAAAAEAAVAGQDRRDAVEALVGLAAITRDAGVLDRLDRACRESGISLLPREIALLAAVRPGTALA